MVGESLFPGGNSTSIVMGLGQLIFNGEMPDMFMSNGYLVMKSAANDLFLVLDPETGILRDVMIMNSTISGSYCYSDQQAEWAFDLAEQLLNNPLNIPWMGSIPSLAMGLNVFAPGASFPGLGSLSSFFTSVGVSGPAAEALAGLTRFARNPLSAALIGVGITTFVVGNYLCDKYGWLPPEQARQVLGNAFPVFSIINMIYYDDQSPNFDLSNYNPSNWPRYFNEKGINPESADELQNHFKRGSIQTMRNAEQLQEMITLVANIGDKEGDDKYDEAGIAINTLSRKAGEGFARAADKLKTGNWEGASADLSISILQIYVACFLKMAFP
jgi:hypothetical protein